MSSKSKVVRSLVIALQALGRDKEARDVLNCSRHVRVFGEPTCKDVRLHPIRCNHPLCPTCARDRTLILRRKIRFLMDSDRANPLRFLTLTLRNVGNIDREYVAWVYECFKKLRALKLWGNRVLGGVYAADTTYNETTGEWHVHLHVLIQVRKPTEAERRAHWYKGWTADLKREWYRITGNSWVLRLQGVTRKAINELVKYQAKAATFVSRPELVDEYLRAFHGVRRIQTFGTWFDLDFEVPPADWTCKCGKSGFEHWLRLGSVPRCECEEDSEGQLSLKFPDIVWGLAGFEDWQPIKVPDPAPDFVPQPESLFYQQANLFA